LENIFSRIRQIINYYEISNNEFGRSIGCSSAQITQMLTHEKNFGIDKLLKILSAYPGINTDWLLKGIEPMLKQNPQKLLIYSSGDDNESTDSRNVNNDKSQTTKANNTDSGELTKIMDRMVDVMKSNAEIAKLSAEVEKAKVEVERIKAEADKLNAEGNERNSRSMEIVISSLLASGKTPHEKKRTTSENSP